MTADTIKHCGIVLAGGKSSRMGKDKALLTFDGETLLDRAIAAIKPLVTEVIVVVDREDRYSLPAVRKIVDLYPESGPVGGIVTGLLAAGEGYHYIIPCDMPLLNRQILLLLMESASPPYDAVIPEWNGFPEPVFAVYSHEAVPKLKRFLEEGGRAAQRALDQLKTLRIEESVLKKIDPSGRFLFNMNEPGDLELLHPKNTE